MRAIEMSGDGKFEIVEVDEPRSEPGNVTVDVEYTSLNRGELMRARAAPAGFRPGWDFAGIVTCAGGRADLAEGTRVKALAPFDLVIETLGGETLGHAMTMLTASGKCVTLGVTDNARVSFDAERFFMTGTASLEGYVLFRDHKATAAQGMMRLLSLVEDGRLKVPIGLCESWETIEEVAEQLIARTFAGKAVLRIKGAPTQ